MALGPERSKTIFLAALDLPDAERDAYLLAQCGADAALRGEVDDLLRHHAQADEAFLAQANVRTAPQIPAGAGGGAGPSASGDDVPGAMIGPYKLLEPIGEGGMGTVWLAEQSRPVRRPVALKVIRPGMDSAQVLARFEAERQALALMEHPNIARIFDGGIAEPASPPAGPEGGLGGRRTRGRPYFVMELIRGFPITTYCDEYRLSIRERLELLATVCDAVQHAHQKGVIHRDLKPSNVLVAHDDVVPLAKVIDFGVAKAVGAPLTDATLHTAFTQVLGTPLYMSPEQAALHHLAVDTRSDIYALGVMMYELLAGSTPFSLEQLEAAGFDGMRRMIAEEEPPRPSARLSTVGADLATISDRRRVDPRQIAFALRGELDWIVMKCLEKDRRRRYESAGALAADLRHYLKGELVTACPPTLAYRLGKFVRRNRAVVVASTLVATSLSAGVIGTTVGLVRANEQRRQADAHAQQAMEREAETRAVLEFLETRLLAAARPQRQAGGLGSDVTVREAIDAALPHVAESFADQPLLEARLRMTLGLSFSYLGYAKAAEAQCLRARDLYAAKFGPHHPSTLSSLHNLAVCYQALGKYAASRKLNEEILALRKAHLPGNHPDTLRSLTNLANNDFALNRHEEALRLREQTLELQKEVRGPHHRETLQGMNNIGNSFLALGQVEKARDQYQLTLGLMQTKDPHHPDILSVRMNLAVCLGRLGRHEAARDLEEETLKLKIAKFGAEHAETLSSMLNLAAFHARLKQPEKALELGRRALPLLEVRRGPTHPNTLLCLANVAAFLRDLNREDEALPLIDECWKRAAGRPVNPELLPELIAHRLAIHQRKKDAAGCRATAEMWERLNRTDADSLYLAARLRAATAALLKDDPKAPAGAEADRAMTWLHKAVAAGFRGVKLLREDKEFDGLRERPDFQRLLTARE